MTSFNTGITTINQIVRMSVTPNETIGTVDINVRVTGDTPLAYYWDFDGDGDFVEKPGAFWMGTNELGGAGTHTVQLKVVDEYGIESEPVSVTIQVDATAPSIIAQKTVLDSTNQLVKFNLTVSYPGGQNAKQWVVNWGDGTRSQVNVITDRLAIAHYYQPSNTTPNTITLSLIDMNDQGGEITWIIGSHLVTAPNHVNNQVVEPELLAAQVIEEIEQPCDYIATTAARNDTSLSLRVGLDATMSNRLLYWDTQASRQRSKANTTGRFAAPTVREFVPAIPLVKTPLFDGNPLEDD
ncbi:MAG: hypothetical protein Q4G59_09055, partial [Planctomycetia bacterium]|nr:hypothetical protein [Planctomycetia bacterium]